MLTVYSVFIHIYTFGIRIASFLNPKAKKAIDGRVNWQENLKKEIDKNSPWIWMHCSSLGEFEQGRPVFEAIKKKFPEYKLALSFFSPSGYEIRKNYELADVVFYLPLDTPSNASELVKILQPKYWILVKYDYWYNHLRAQHKAGTKIIVISSIFRENQIYFKPTGSWMAKNLKKYISHFFVQDEKSKKLLEKINIKNVTVAGDTRYDRVKSIALETEKLSWVENFKANKKLIVIGSSWEKDEEFWIQYNDKYPPLDWKIIFVPHEINTQRIQKLKNSLDVNTLIYSEISTETNLYSYDILIVDAIGFLSKIYASADLAYVGGGFNKSGVHNTLEPAVFGIPVIIGPNYQKFKEVKLLKENLIIHSIKNYQDFELILMNLMSNTEKRKLIALTAKELFENQLPATKIIMKYLS